MRVTYSKVKKNCEKIFKHDKGSGKPGRQTLKAFDYSKQDTQQNTYDKGYVECFPCGCIGFEDNDIQLML